MSDTLLQLNSNSLSGTLASLRYRKNPSSSGLKMSSACPLPPERRKQTLGEVNWFSDQNSGTIPWPSTFGNIKCWLTSHHRRLKMPSKKADNRGSFTTMPSIRD